MGFLKGVKSFSSRVTACSKKLKSKTPGFLKGVSRISSRCVRACSRKSKSETPKVDPASCSSRESKSETPKKQKPQFVHATLKATNPKSASWVPMVRKLMSEMLISSDEGVRSCVWDREAMVHISGTVYPDLFMRRVEKLIRSGHIDVEHCQFGNCSSHLFRKKEAPSTKNPTPPTNNANPSTNNANPSTNNANTTVGCYQPQGYRSYYGNGGYHNAGLYGNGGYYDYFAYNGGYNGNSYNYQPEPATYQNRIAYEHIDCAGDASECSFHHNEKAVTPDKTRDKSSENTVPKPAGSRKRD